MAKKFGTLLFAASLLVHFLGVATPAWTAPSDLDQLTRVAEQSLPLESESGSQDAALARRLVGACFSLARLSPERHEQVCVGNPALLSSIRLLSARRDVLSAEERGALEFYGSSPPSPGPSARPLPMPQPPPLMAEASAVQRQAVSTALAAEITKLSMDYRSASVRGSLARRIDVEARLRTLYSDLQRALGEKSHLLPADPHAFVSSKEVLTEAVNTYRAEQRYFDLFTVLVNNPDVQVTRDSLSEEIARLEALISTDQPGQFHRARAEIEAAIDPAQWNALSETREQRVAAERARVAREWRAKYPTSLLTEASPKSAAGGTSWSSRALNAVSSYALDPVEWVEAESELLAAYTRLHQSGQTSKTYAEWVASLLDGADLESALLYSKAMTAQTAGAASPLDPLAPHRDYFSTLSKTFQGEWFIRRRGGPRSPLPPETAPDPEMLKLRKLYAVRLIKQRYGDLSYAPSALRDMVRESHTEFSNDDFNKALKLYEELGRQTEKAALSNKVLDSRQLTQLTKAREAVLRTFLRADEIFTERISEGVLAPNPNTRKTKAIIAELKAARPPNDSGPGMEGRPPAPPDSPTALLSSPSPKRPIPPGKGTAARPLEVTDAQFLAEHDAAQNSLRELKASLAQVQTTPKAAGAELGRLTVSDSDVWSGHLDYTHQTLNAREARLPKGLQDWRGLVNPVTKKPYAYQTDVKNFRTFDAVGGGIHFGDEASLRVPADLSEFVLTYDDKAQMLVLCGPGDKRYLYGPLSPLELKALYRFALSGQNAAISVGWAGPTEVNRFGAAGQPVLLDPAFVDTPVGQTLFEADSIPWELDRVLPGGIANPFADSFKRAYEERDREARRPMLRFFASVPGFDDRPAFTWLALFNGDGIADVLARSLLKNLNDIQAAKTEYLSAMRVTESELLLGSPNLTEKVRQDIRKYLNSVAIGTRELDRWAVKRARPRDALLDICTSFVATGNVETKWMVLWAALYRTQLTNYTPEKLTDIFIYILPSPTLAVLTDEPTTILLNGDRIKLNGTMRYRYATGSVLVTRDKVMAGRGLPAGTEQVKELSGLTQLANDALPKLAELYKPLELTTRYAGIVAFLRWAHAGKRLLAVDFFNLAAYPASDRTHTPTPDAVLR